MDDFSKKAQSLSPEKQKLLELSLKNKGILQSYAENLRKRSRQEIVEGEVKLLCAHKFFFDSNFTDMHHWNGSLMLYCRDGFDVKVLRTVFDKLAEHHDALRIVYKFKDGKVTQYNRGIEGELYSLKVCDFTDAGEDSRALVAEKIKAETDNVQKSIDLSNGPLLKMALFKTSAGDHLLIVLHHLISDTISIQILLDDAVTAYMQVVTGHSIKLPDKTDSIMYFAEKLHEYAHSDELLKEVEFWSKWEEKKVAPLPRDHRVTANRIKDSKTLRIVLLPENKTKKLLQISQAGGPEVVIILLTAFGLTIKEWTSESNVLVQIVTHGRNLPFKDVNITRTIGWISSAYPLMLEMVEGDNISRQVQVVTDTMRNMPGNGMGYGIFETLAPPEFAARLKLNLKPEISFNYLGVNVSAPEDAPQVVTLSPLPTGEDMSQNTERRHAFLLDLNIFDGTLNLKFNYNQYEYDENTVQYLVDSFSKNIERVAANYN